MTYGQLVFEGRDTFEVTNVAVRRGSPKAISVADRWHLLYNLTEILKKLLTENSHYLKETRKEEITKELDLKVLAKEQAKREHFELNSIYHEKFVEVSIVFVIGVSYSKKLLILPSNFGQ